MIERVAIACLNTVGALYLDQVRGGLRVVSARIQLALAHIYTLFYQAAHLRAGRLASFAAKAAADDLRLPFLSGPKWCCYGTNWVCLLGDLSISDRRENRPGDHRHDRQGSEDAAGGGDSFPWIGVIASEYRPLGADASCNHPRNGLSASEPSPRACAAERAASARRTESMRLRG